MKNKIKRVHLWVSNGRTYVVFRRQHSLRAFTCPTPASVARLSSVVYSLVNSGGGAAKPSRMGVGWSLDYSVFWMPNEEAA